MVILCSNNKMMMPTMILRDRRWAGRALSNDSDEIESKKKNAKDMVRLENVQQCQRNR